MYFQNLFQFLTFEVPYRTKFPPKICFGPFWSTQVHFGSFWPILVISGTILADSDFDVPVLRLKNIFIKKDHARSQMSVSLSAIQHAATYSRVSLHIISCVVLHLHALKTTLCKKLTLSQKASKFVGSKIRFQLYLYFVLKRANLKLNYYL